MPPTTVSSSYVASGINGVCQSVVGAGSTDSENESEDHRETSAQVAPIETSIESTLSEALSAAEVALVIPVTIVPATNALNVLSTPLFAGTEATPPAGLSDTLATQELQQFSTAPESQQTLSQAALSEPEPVDPKPKQIAASAVLKFGRTITPKPEQVVPSSVPGPVVFTAQKVGLTTLAAPAPENTGVSVVPERVATTTPEPEASTHAPVSFSSKAFKTASYENGASANRAAVPSASNPAVDDPNCLKEVKHAFPGSEKDEGDGISSRTGSSSLRKKKHPAFGRALISEGANVTVPRKKSRSFFGKVKHMFDKKD